MKKFILDKKGFTLVELLAVIVILVLIMGLAFYSLQGVIENVRHIEGVRKNMLVDKMGIVAGDYYISYKMLEKNVESPWGQYQYYSGSDTNITSGLNNKGYAEAGATLTCGGSSPTGSFVRVTENNGEFTFAICLYDNAKRYVVGTESHITSDDPEAINNSSNATCDLAAGTCS